MPSTATSWSSPGNDRLEVELRLSLSLAGVILFAQSLPARPIFIFVCPLPEAKNDAVGYLELALSLDLTPALAWATGAAMFLTVNPHAVTRVAFVLDEPTLLLFTTLR